MRRIYKYKLAPVEVQTITMPRGAEVLSAVEQNGGIVLYAKVNPFEGNDTLCHVQIYGTGHDMDENYMIDYEFIDTVNMDNGNLMFHVFCKVL